MTNKEINAAVKSELKAAGYNVKDFRVSVKDSLYDGVIRVTVKKPLRLLSRQSGTAKSKRKKGERPALTKQPPTTQKGTPEPYTGSPP